MKPGKLFKLACACLAVIQFATGAWADQTVHKVGKVTWHAEKYAGKVIVLQGYVLAHESGYVLFSDEATGKISAHDLPVSGDGALEMEQNRKYLVTGMFTKGGLVAVNASPYHLVLTRKPEIVNR